MMVRLRDVSAELVVVATLSACLLYISYLHRNPVTKVVEKVIYRQMPCKEVQ
jgi:hypothetical protein